MELLQNPFFQRMFMTVLAIGCGVLAAVLPGAQVALAAAGGALLSWAHLTKPGDVAVNTLPKAVQESLKPPKMFPTDIPIRMKDGEDT